MTQTFCQSSLRQGDCSVIGGLAADASRVKNTKMPRAITLATYTSNSAQTFCNTRVCGRTCLLYAESYVSTRRCEVFTLASTGRSLSGMASCTKTSVRKSLAPLVP